MNIRAVARLARPRNKYLFHRQRVDDPGCFERCVRGIEYVCENVLRTDHGKVTLVDLHDERMVQPFMDLWRYGQDIAEDLQAYPHEFLGALEEAADTVDLPVAVDFSDVTVRVTGIPHTHTYDV